MARGSLELSWRRESHIDSAITTTRADGTTTGKLTPMFPVFLEARTPSSILRRLSGMSEQSPGSQGKEPAVNVDRAGKVRSRRGQRHPIPHLVPQKVLAVRAMRTGRARRTVPAEAHNQVTSIAAAAHLVREGIGGEGDAQEAQGALWATSRLESTFRLIGSLVTQMPAGVSVSSDGVMRR